MTTRDHADAPETGIPLVFDRHLIALRRHRALAAGNAVPDFLLRRVGDDFAERLGAVRRSFPIGLNLGFHGQTIANALACVPNIERLFNAETCDFAGETGVDLVADEEALPVADASLDLALSALSLHLVNDLPGTFAQLRRALKPDGLFLAALLGGSTLTELREAFLMAETELTGGASPRVAPFADVRSLGGLLQRAGFALPVIDSDCVTVRYGTPIGLMKDLKAMGASNPLTDRSRVPMRRDILLRAADIYSDRFAAHDGRIPATFEIITLTAWAPDASQPQPLKPGSAQISLSEVLTQRR